MAPDSGGNTVGQQLGANVVDQASRTGKAADTVNNPNSMIERTRRLQTVKAVMPGPGINLRPEICGEGRVG